MNEKTERDPVCGMRVAVANAPASTQYDGKRYYFCSAACKNTFDEEPEEYAGSKQAMHAHGCC